jgi:hypothetical protein
MNRSCQEQEITKIVNISSAKIDDFLPFFSSSTMTYYSVHNFHQRKQQYYTVYTFCKGGKRTHSGPATNCIALEGATVTSCTIRPFDR